MKNDEIKEWLETEYILIDYQKEYPKDQLMDPIEFKEIWGKR